MVKNIYPLQFFTELIYNFNMMERKSTNYALFIGALSILGIMAFSPHLAYAPSHPEFQPIDPPTILPDSPFYGFKLAIENIQEALTFQDERKAELILKHAEERDREAVELERQMKIIPLERLNKIQAQKLRDAELIIMRLERAHNIAVQEEQAMADRRELAQAGTDQQRVAIQLAQQERDRGGNSFLIEPAIGVSTLIEPTTERVADRPIMLIRVEDIQDTDDQTTILMKLRDRLQNSFSSAQITEIRAKFSEIRDEEDPIRRERLADQLDDEVNSPIVSITCLGTVDTLALSLAIDPVKELQQQCPILRPFDTEVVRDIVNGGN